jgi:long-chain acyl-CoA synthetase
MSPWNYSLYDLLKRNADSLGGHLALLTEAGEAVTFAELLDCVDRLGTGLTNRGLETGDRLAILAQNSTEFFELYFACARNGYVAYPLNWRWSVEEIERMLERAGARAFLVDALTMDKVPDSLADSDLVLRAQIGGGESEGFCALASLYEDGDSRPNAVASDSPFMVIATAAVDVIPRGAILSHTNILASSAQQIAAMGLTSEDRNLLALPLFHIAGLGNAFAVLQAGGANILMPKFDPAAAVRLIDEWKVTYLSDFPPVLTNVLDAAAEASSELSSLRIVSGLDAPDTMQRLHAETSADFWTGFGQTETSGFVTLQRVRDLPGAAGKAGNLTSVDLVDDDDRPVPVGTAGEIVVRGPLVFLGYDGQKDVTDYTFRKDWHHTGDVGRFDDGGTLYYVKRKPEKELIKPGGENVYPAEVENTIMEMDDVTGVCVFGVPDPKWGEGIKAIVETPAELDAAAVREHVGSRIARFKRPQHVVFTEALPRNEEGAIDREAVKERWS